MSKRVANKQTTKQTDGKHDNHHAIHIIMNTYFNRFYAQSVLSLPIAVVSHVRFILTHLFHTTLEFQFTKKYKMHLQLRAAAPG